MNETTQATSTMTPTEKQVGSNSPSNGCRIFGEIVQEYGLQKVVAPPKRLSFGFTTLEEAKLFLQGGLEYYLNLEGKGKQAQWLPAYDEIAEWLYDNNEKGLFLFGGCGLGKTVITTKILPAYFAYITDNRYKVGSGLSITDARDLRRVFQQGKAIDKIQIVDDVGTESESVEFGNRRDLFPELMDLAEKRGLMVVASSNLTGEQLKAKYEERTMQRLKSCTRPIRLDGASFR